MKHTSTRNLYAYWDERRGHRATPDRADIDPTAIPRVLGDTFLLGGDTPDEPVFRLAGTRVCALFCRELRGEAFFALFSRTGRQAIRNLFAVVTDEAVGSVAGLTGRIADRSEVELELLLLPLRHRGRTNTRILGVLAPIGAPYWLGVHPVTDIELGTIRHIGPLVESIEPAPLPIPLHAGRMRHGLVVYDGGRS